MISQPMLGIGAIIVGIVAVIMTIVLYRRTSKLVNSGNDILWYLTNLVPNTAPDPDTVRRLIDDYQKSGEWRGRVFRYDDKYSIAFDMSLSETIKIGENVVVVKKTAEK